MYMWYWAVMVLLILGSIALLCSTFISVKKNKAQDAERRKQSKKGKRYKADQGYDPEEEEDQPQGKKRRSSGQNGSVDSAKRSSKKRRQWKIILEDLDTWQKYSFIFYDEVGIGRAKRNDNYEKYLPLHEDGRVSKQHCVIIQRGDCLYLMDDGSKNGTYLNGIIVDRPTEIQREDVIGVGETRLEILRILRESE